MSNKITVVKYSPYGEEKIRYPAEVLERQGDERIVVEARFSPTEIQVGGLKLEVGDRFVESYSSKDWFNIYEVHGVRDDKLKGWYCNVSYPAEIGRDLVSYRDLALDLVVLPDGRQEVLDEDEFEALELAADVKATAREGLAELQQRFRERFEKNKKPR